MSTKLTLYKANDQWVKLEGMQNGKTGDYLTAATITATLYDTSADPQPVTGCTGITFTYDPLASVQGTYYGQITDIFNPVAGSYILVILGVDNGINITARVKVKVVERYL